MITSKTLLKNSLWDFFGKKAIKAVLAGVILMPNVLTAQTSGLVGDYTPGTGSTSPFIIGEANNEMFFYTSGNDDYEIHKYNAATNQFTQVTNDFPAYASSVVMRNFFIVGNDLIFSGRRGTSQ